MAVNNSIQKQKKDDDVTDRAIKWIGSVKSLVAHTIIFTVCFALSFLGVPIDKILLVLTTLVSLEAIYLAIFIQMAVNRAAEDIDEIQEDVDEIEKDIDDIQEDIDEIEKGDTEDEKIDKQNVEVLNKIESKLQNLIAEIERIKHK